MSDFPNDSGACDAPLPAQRLNDSGACDAPLPAQRLNGSGACDAPLRPDRRTVRLAGYDYSQAGWYFVTIMTQDRAALFGHVTPEAQVVPTPLGEAVCQSWHELTTRYAQLHADCWVLMPNHVHLILGLLPATARVPAKSLGQLVGAFKATCTRRGRSWHPGPASFWQRNYHEHVIRTALDLDNHRQYVRHNPRRWAERLMGGAF